MSSTRLKNASRGSARTKPQTPDLGRSTKLPLISTSLSSTEESSLSFWSPARPPGYAVGICSQQGKRPYQEDQYAIRQFVHNLASGKNAAETHMFGLFDGHAGGRCSTHLSNSLANVLVEEESFVANLPLALKKSFYTVNEQFLKIAEKNKWHDGSTGNVAVIRDGKLTVANVGDCRALLISNGRPLQMSNDHKPTNPEEQKRIASLGGAVVYCMGVARVNKVLAVSRAFGNRTLRQVIRPDAELMQRELVTGDDFLVMASDGLWDVLRNKDVSDVCYSSYLQRRPQAIADELVNMALSRGSMDNVTCIVVNLADYRPAVETGGEEVSFRRSGNAEMNLSMTSSLPRSGGLGVASLGGGNYGLSGESVVDTQYLNSSDSDDNEDTENSAIQYAATAATSIRLRTAIGINPSSNGHNNNHPGHDIPSKQRSLGAINPRDLPTLGGDTDPFGLKNPRGQLVKAVSTNSMSSQENAPIDQNSNSNLTNTSFGISSDRNNSANGFLRPLTAIDAAPTTTVGNLTSSLKPSFRSNNNSNNSSGSNQHGYALMSSSSSTYPELSISAVPPVMGTGTVGQGNKLAQIRAMKNSTTNNTNATSSNLDAMSAMQQIRTMSRQGGNAIPRPQSQAMYPYGG